MFSRSIMSLLTERAYASLVASGVNALVEHGLNLSYESVSDFEKQILTMSDEPGVDAHFAIGEVRCVATSKPAGCGEERITILYGSSNLTRAKQINGCSNARFGTSTAARVTLERWNGPYIMDRQRGDFRCTRVDKATLASLDVQPQGYETSGPIIY